ncbi:MAG: hypothetical protein IT580_19780 [Verrucomicrobiales bacterium]|nr:hypothetical protein [Verrucomicrobiales bacterium]
MLSRLQLRADQIVERISRHGNRPPPPSLAWMIGYAVFGFTVLSVSGFVPWAVFGRALHQSVGEAGMYAVCAAVFIGLSGPLLHRLLLGPGALGRFTLLFALAFVPYSIAWIAAWMLLGGHTGSLVGLLAGTSLMGLVLARAFGARAELGRVILALFALNAAGYFIGGWVEGWLMHLENPVLLGYTPPRKIQRIGAMLSWGVCYGLGFGAGLGVAFHLCQRRVRELLSGSPPPAPPASSAQGPDSRA